jgi:hypothetical protein
MRLDSKDSSTMQMPSWQAVKPPPTQHVLRKHPRYLLSVPVLVYESSGTDPAWAHGLTLDLSQGGVSAVLCGSLHVHQSFRLELCLPNRTLSALAIVRYSSPNRCGFEFLSSSPDFDKGVADCIRNLIR